MILFSGNWELPEAAPVGKKKIRTALGDARGILKQYVEHHANEAVVVAGYHPTPTDPKYHLTIRCNAVPGGHRYTFHLYLNQNGAYSDQQQTHP